MNKKDLLKRFKKLNKDATDFYKKKSALDKKYKYLSQVYPLPKEKLIEEDIYLNAVTTIFKPTRFVHRYSEGVFIEGTSISTSTLKVFGSTYIKKDLENIELMDKNEVKAILKEIIKNMFNNHVTRINDNFNLSLSIDIEDKKWTKWKKL